eukprot:scaffold28279_cov134-Isochrysis_galbana.AAC.7
MSYVVSYAISPNLCAEGWCRGSVHYCYDYEGAGNETPVRVLHATRMWEYECRRVPLSEGTARPGCGRGEVRGVWRRSGREPRAPGLLCRRSVDRSSLLYMWFLVACAPTR